MAPLAAGAQPTPPPAAPLRVALFASFPPMSYCVPETNGLTGVDVDLAFSFLDEPASRDRLEYADYLASGTQAYAL